MVTSEVAKKITSASFLTWLTAGHDLISEAKGLPKVTVDEVKSNGPKVSARLTTASGDAYRVTVEWLSEDSP